MKMAFLAHPRLSNCGSLADGIHTPDIVGSNPGSRRFCERDSWPEMRETLVAVLTIASAS